MKAHYGCPVQATINVLSGKWKVQAVWRLSFGPLRFAAEGYLLAQPLWPDLDPAA